MQGIPEPCFFQGGLQPFHRIHAFEGLCKGCLNLNFLGGLQQFLVCQTLEVLCKASLNLAFFKEACSNSILFMPLRSYARHPWTLLFQGGLQQFLIVYAFEVLCKASLNLVFFVKECLQQFLMVFAFEVLCKASPNLVFLIIRLVNSMRSIQEGALW